MKVSDRKMALPLLFVAFLLAIFLYTKEELKPHKKALATNMVLLVRGEQLCELIFVLKTIYMQALSGTI